MSMAFDPTEDDPELGQTPSPGGAPPGQPAPQPAPPGGGGPGAGLAAFARSRMGPQISAPGPGNMADAGVLVQQAVKLCQQAAMGLPAGSPMHRDCLRAASSLSRHLGGAQSMGMGAGVQATSLKDQLKRTVQQQLLQRLFGQQRGGQPGKGPMDQPQPPMPSTPLPGS